MGTVRFHFVPGLCDEGDKEKDEEACPDAHLLAMEKEKLWSQS